VSRALAPLGIATIIIVGVQVSALSSWRFAGAVVMLVWLWPIAVGLAGSPGLAVGSALFGGILFDTHVTTPFGLTALVGAIVGYGAGYLGREGVGDLESAALYVAPVIASIGGFVAPLLYVIGGFFYFNFSLWRGSLLASMLVNAIAFFLLARPVVRFARLATRFAPVVRR
jgi:rod shape-determining protein MreD